MNTIVFAVSGDAREAASESFRKVLGSFEPGIDATTAAAAGLPPEARKAIDPIGVATLIVSIPSAVLAVIDIADRIGKRRRAQKLIDEAKRLRAEQQVEIQIVVGATAESLAELTPDALLDAARDDR